VQRAVILEQSEWESIMDALHHVIDITSSACDTLNETSLRLTRAARVLHDAVVSHAAGEIASVSDNLSECVLNILQKALGTLGEKP